MAGVKLGQDIILKYGTKLISHVISHDMNIAVTVIPTTDMLSSGRSTTHIPGRYNVTFNFEGNYASDDSTNEDFYDLVTKALNGTSATAYWGSETAGEDYYSISGFVSNLSIKAQDDNVTSFSGSFQGSGALTLNILT